MANDQPIRPGDLVMAVRCHCERQESGSGGRIYVAEAYGDPITIVCPHCNGEYGEGMPQIAITSSLGTRCYHPAAWLKRIKPLDDDEQIEHADEVTA